MVTGRTNQTLAIIFAVSFLLDIYSAEINRDDVLFTESDGERRTQAAMKISQGKTRCSVFYIIYTFVEQDSETPRLRMV